MNKPKDARYIYNVACVMQRMHSIIPTSGPLPTYLTEVQQKIITRVRKEQAWGTLANIYTIVREIFEEE
jgi:mevalonate pyrophosphate decarboxylase